MTTFYEKDPDETVPVIADYTDRLNDGESIVTSVWTVPVPPTEGANVFDINTATVQISAGAANTSYAILHRATTSEGNLYETNIVLRVFGDGSTIIVEDGTGIANAVSYISVADADALMLTHAARDTWFDLNGTQKADKLIQATAYLDRKFKWYGLSLFPTVQALDWPRTQGYDDKGNLFAQGIVPAQLELATTLTAVALTEDEDLETLSRDAEIVKSWSGDGVSIGFDVSDKAQQAGLMGNRLIDVELILKSIGEVKTGDYLSTKRTDPIQ